MNTTIRAALVGAALLALTAATAQHCRAQSWAETRCDGEGRCDTIYSNGDVTTTIQRSDGSIHTQSNFDNADRWYACHWYHYCPPGWADLPRPPGATYGEENARRQQDPIQGLR